MHVHACIGLKLCKFLHSLHSLKVHMILTTYIVDLLQVIHRSSSPNPNAQLLTAVRNFKEWMVPFLAVIEGHSKYHVFRFTLGKSRRAELHYKRFSSLPWEPEDTGITVLSVMLIITIKYPSVTNCKKLLVASYAYYFAASSPGSR